LHGELIDLAKTESRSEISSSYMSSNLLKFDFKIEIDDSTKPSSESLGRQTEPEVEISDFKMHHVQLKTKELNEKLRKNRFDEKLWIELIDLQDQVTEE
jgi:hypothetical protein